MELITKSRMAAQNACQRLHQYLYVDGYRSLNAKPEADFGTFFHAGLDAWWAAHQGGNGPMAYEAAGWAMAEWLKTERHALDVAQVAKAELLMKAYDARWADSMEDLEVLGIEEEFVATIPGMKGIRVAGKLDKRVRRRSTGEVGFVDHKTSGADLSPESSYWSRLRMDPQVSLYYVGARTLGDEPTFCIYDVIVRPAQRPLKATPEALRKYTKDKRLYANQRENDETPDEFQARMAEKILGAPDEYFARATVPRLDRELDAAMADLASTARQIRRNARDKFAPRNPDHCFKWGRPCDFWDVCSGTADINDQSRFERVENVHQELTLVTIKKNPKEKGKRNDRTSIDHDERQATLIDFAAEASSTSTSADAAE